MLGRNEAFKKQFLEGLIQFQVSFCCQGVAKEPQDSNGNLLAVINGRKEMPYSSDG